MDTQTHEGDKIVTLQHPFKWADDQGDVTEITVFRPKVFHMRGIDFKKLDGNMDEMLKLVHKLTGHPPKFLDKIDFTDLEKIIEVITGFLDSGQKSGSSS